MAETAFKTQYRDETIAVFEQGRSYLMDTAAKESVISGSTATFLTAGTGGREAVTRGVNGLIPSNADDLTQTVVTLTEWHDKPRRTKFNIFASQGNGRMVMQQNTVKVINRKADQLMLTALGTATNDTGAAVTGSLNLAMKARAILGNAEVDIEEEDNMFAVITPAFEAYLMQVKEFSSSDYVEVKPFAGPVRRMRRWAGTNWIVHSRMAGRGTNAEVCFMFHRNALGFAIDREGMDITAGYNEEESYYWARTSAFMGSGLLQNSGVCVMNHDGSGFAAS
jgi:hypothetical protein